MERKQKIISLIFLVLSLGAMVMLATTLSSISFQPGQPFRLPTQAETSSVPRVAGNADFLFVIIRGIIALALVLFPLALLYLLFSREGRKRLLRSAITILFLYLLLTFVSRITSLQPLALQTQAGQSPSGAQLTNPAPLAVFDRNPPRWLESTVTLGLGLLLGGIVYGFIRLLARKPTPNSPDVDEIAEQAQAAISSIQSGQDLRDVILKCYREMSQILQTEQGIQRSPSMTPSEFQRLLTQRGFPQPAVASLTRLFEDVRYGSHTPGRQEEQLAVSSLSAIVAACRSLK